MTDRSSWSAIPESIRSQIRAAIAATLPAPCRICGATIPAGGRFHVEHGRPCRDWPELVLDLDNLGPAHPACNLHKGDRELEVRPWLSGVSIG